MLACPRRHQASDYEISSAIIDAMWDQMTYSEFIHIGEKNQLAEILRVKLYGIRVVHSALIYRLIQWLMCLRFLIDVPEVTDDVTLQAALMTALPTKAYATYQTEMETHVVDLVVVTKLQVTKQSVADFDYRILTATNNTIELGHKCCYHRPRSMQMCHGNE
jgi:hypothetical protein